MDEPKSLLDILFDKVKSLEDRMPDPDRVWIQARDALEQEAIERARANDVNEAALKADGKRIEELEAYVQRLQSEAAEASKRNAELESEVVQKCDEILDMDLSINSAKSVIEKLTGRIEPLESENKNLLDQVTDLMERELKDNEDLKAQVKEMEKAAESGQAIIDSWIQRASELDSSLGHAEQVNAELTERISKVLRKDSVNHEAAERIRDLEGQNRELMRQVEELRADVEESDGLVQEVKELRLDKVRLDIQFASLNTQVDALADRLEHNVPVPQRIREAFPRIQELEGQVAERDRRIQQLADEVANLRAQVGVDLLDENRGLRVDLDNADQRNRALRSELDKLSGFADKMDKLDDLYDRMEELLGRGDDDERY